MKRSTSADMLTDESQQQPQTGLRDFEDVSPNINVERLDALAVEQAKGIKSSLFTTRGVWVRWL